MKWGDQMERGSLRSVLAALTDANAAFTKLTDAEGVDKLLEEIEKLKIDQLREIVLSRVLAAQLQLRD